MMVSEGIYAFLACLLLHWCDAIRPAHDVIQFKEPSGGYNNEWVYDVQRGEVITLYGGWRNPSIIILNNPVAVTIKIDLLVESLDPKYELKKVSICNDNQCENAQSLTKPDLKIVKWKVEFDKRKGATLSADIPVETKITKKTLLYFQLENGVSRARTNDIYVYDNRQTFAFASVDTVAVPGDISANQPSEFKCRTLAKLDFLPPEFRWFIGDGDKKENPEDLSEIGRQLKWPVQIKADGSLYWPYIAKEAIGKLQGKRIFCKVEGSLAAHSTADLKISADGPSGNAVTEPKAEMYPVAQMPRLLFNEVKPPRMGCFFKVGRGSYTVQFLISKTVLKEGMNENEKYKVRVNGSDVFGYSRKGTGFKIKCRVSWTKTDGSTKTSPLSSVNYPVLWLPAFSEPLPFYGYAVEGGSLAVSCPVTKDSEVKANVAINGKELVTKITDSVKKTLQEIREETKKPIYGEVNIGEVDYGRSATFTATKMVMATGTTPSSACRMECVGGGHPIDSKSNPFTLRQPIILSAIPEPKMATEACVNCSYAWGSNDLMTCSLQNKEKLMYDGIDISYEWSLMRRDGQSINITEFPKIFTFQESKSESSLRVKLPCRSQSVLRDLGFGKSESSTNWTVSCKLKVKNSVTGREIWSEVQSEAIILKCIFKRWIIVVVVIIVVLLVFVIIIVVVIVCCKYVKCCRECGNKYCVIKCCGKKYKPVSVLADATDDTKV